MDQRREFVRLAEAGTVSLSELCRRFGISRQTGHTLLRRYREAGDVGLLERSRCPHSSPRRSPDALEQRVVSLRAQHPSWGGRKLARRLADLGVGGVPAASTVTAILRRHGLVDPAEAARHRPYTRFAWEQPNDLWQMDFKGHFPTETARCHTLTVLDDCTRYALGLCACTDETETTVRTQLTALFRRYGLPWRLLADNGSPWGNTVGLYTALGVWLMRLDVLLWHGRAYHPQTQGKAERFHRTMRVELLQARRFHDIADCQAALNEWRGIYNTQRPHEALEMATPASRYQPSPRSFPDVLPEPEYHASDIVRRVQRDGYLSFQGTRFKLSQAFHRMPVALRPTHTDGPWDVFFMRFHVAQINLRTQTATMQPVRDVSEHLSGMSPV